MPTTFTTRKKESEVIAAISKIGMEGAVNYHFAKVPVTGTGDIEPLGTPVVWNETDAFEVYVAQDISLVGDSILPDGSPVAVTVGTYEYVGANEADVTLSGVPTEMWVIFRGEGAVKYDGIEWGTAVAGDIAEFRRELEKQGLAVVEGTPAATPALV